MFVHKWKRLYPFGAYRSHSRSWFLLLTAALLTAIILCHFSQRAGDLARMVTAATPADLTYLKHNRDLHTYIDDILDPLIEPSSTPCEELEQVEVLVLVSSAPSRVENRQAIRRTWAQDLPTYFFLGLDDTNTIDDQLVDNYMEAKQHGDMVVFRFRDTCHNLTLKTALMLHWSRRRCPHAQFMLKTEDDVLINPWTLRQVVEDNAGAGIVGYRLQDGTAERSVYSKRHFPTWLYSEDTIPEWLSGTGYLISGMHVRAVVEAAYLVPLINLEDIYFTYLVAKQQLGLTLTHEPRLSPYGPALPCACAYWDYALAHNLQPHDIRTIWTKVQALGKEYDSGKPVCGLYTRYFGVLFSSAFMF